MSRLDKKILLRGQHKPEYRVQMSHVDYREPIAIGMRKKSKKRGPLTVSEKIHIVHKVLVEHELYRDVARELRIGVMAVHRVVKLAKSKPGFIEEVTAERDQNQA